MVVGVGAGVDVGVVAVAVAAAVAVVVVVALFEQGISDLRVYSADFLCPISLKSRMCSLLSANGTYLQ